MTEYEAHQLGLHQSKRADVCSWCETEVALAASQAQVRALREVLVKVDEIACRSGAANGPEDEPEPANRDGEELAMLARAALAAPADETALREFGLKVADAVLWEFKPHRVASDESMKVIVDAVLRGER